MGRTNVVLYDDLVRVCQKATGIKTRKALIRVFVCRLQKNMTL